MPRRQKSQVCENGSETTLVPNGTVIPKVPRATTSIARILKIARAAFDDDEKARRWLQEPNIQTGTRPPISLIGTPEGFAVVASVLGQIQYGVFG